MTSTQLTCLGIHLTSHEVRCIITGTSVATSICLLTEEESSDPHAWWTALENALKDLSKDGADLSVLDAISVSGAPYGAVFLDAEGDVLAPAVLAGEKDGASWCDWFEATARRSRSINGNLAKPDMMGVALVYLRERAPDIWKQLAMAVSPKDYLVWRLTGQHTTDPSTASTTLLFDTVQNTWADRILKPVGIPRDILPTLVASDARVGPVQDHVAAATGLPKVPVMAGAADLVATCVALGLEQQGSTFLAMKDQTSMVRLGETFLPDPFRHIDMRSFAGNDMFFHLSEIGPGVDFDDWAKNLGGNPGNGGADLIAQKDVYFLPKLGHGAVLAGLSPQTTPQDMARAVLYGVAFEVAESLATLNELMPVDGMLHCLAPTATGQTWGPYLASATRRTLVLHEDDGFRAASGAARIARRGLAVGTETDSEADERPSQHFEPQAELIAHFEAIRPRLAALKSRLTY